MLHALELLSELCYRELIDSSNALELYVQFARSSLTDLMVASARALCVSTLQLYEDGPDTDDDDEFPIGTFPLSISRMLATST